MTDSINKKLHAHDKMLENINAKLDEFSSVLKNQLSFNKMIETQLAQIATAISSYEKDRIPGKPEKTMETANLVTTRHGYALISGGSYLLDSPFTIKKGDPGVPMISCSIGTHTFPNALCDLGSSINIMSKETYDKLFYTTLAPTFVYVQLADQSTRYLEGVATDLLVKVRSAYVPADFVILDMVNAEDTPLILGRPFLNTAHACIYVASGQIQFHFARRKEIFAFAPGQPHFDEKQEKKKHPKMKKPKPIEDPEKPVKKKKNRKRWRKKKDPSSNSSSPDPDPDKVSEVNQEETPPPKDE
jgi:hypothetical protein